MTNRGRLQALVLLIIVLALVATACSGTASEDTEASPEVVTTEAPPEEHEHDKEVRVVEISMSEFAFNPNVISVKAGETIRFKVTNNGTVPHEFEITTEHAVSEHDHGEDHGVVAGNKIEVAPGETGELEYTFDEAGELLFVCLIPGHLEAGMHGKFVFSDEAAEHSDSVGHHDEHEEDQSKNSGGEEDESKNHNDDDHEH